MLEDLKNHTLFGSSVNDAVDYIKRTPPRWSSHSSTDNRARSDWDLGLGYQGALDMARTGWEQGVRLMHDKLRALPPPTAAHAPLKHDMAGFMADVPRHLSGAPDSMISRGKRKGAKPVIHLVLNSCLSAAISAQEMMNYGVAVAAAIDKMEAGGRQIELDLLCTALPRNQEMRYGWKVKKAGDHIDLAEIAFSIAHPAAFRRICFALIERQSNSLWNNGLYGSPRNINRRDLAAISAEDAFGLNGIGLASQNNGKCATVSGAVRFAAQQINAAAGETLVELDE